MPMNYHERLQRPRGRSSSRCQPWKRSAAREMELAAGGEMQKQKETKKTKTTTATTKTIKPTHKKTQENRK